MGNTLTRSTRATEREGGEGGEGGEGHQVPGGSKQAPPQEQQQQEEEEAYASFERHQSSAKRLPFSQEARTFVDLGRYGTLSTISGTGPQAGFPNGSVVGYAAKEEDGLPVFAFSTLSSHTRDLDKDCRCSLTVTAPGFKGASDGRVTLTGNVQKVTEEKRAHQVREAYKQKHPDAFWVDFGDFSVYEMTDLVHVRLVGGFARYVERL